MIQQVDKALARVYSPGRELHGAGILISPRILITCAHVVSDAFGMDFDDLKQNAPWPSGSVLIDFPLLPTTYPTQHARVLFWSPEDATDMAILELEASAPAMARHANLKELSDMFGHPYVAYGFDEDNGTWTRGIIRGRIANGKIQLDRDISAWCPIALGFSGTAVWDEKEQAVVGMVTSIRKRDSNIAYMIPITRLCQIWKPLGSYVKQPEREQRATPMIAPRKLPEIWEKGKVVQILDQRYLLTEQIQEDNHTNPGLLQRCYKARYVPAPANANAQHVWIKQISITQPELIKNTALQPLKTEAELLKRLSQQSSLFPRVIEIQNRPESSLLIYTALQGKPLTEVFGPIGTPLEVQRIRAILLSLPSLYTMLTLLHTQGFAHRSLALDKLLFNAKGQTLLMDLGLATYPFKSGEGPAATRAPEQKYQGSTIPGTDIYQLGAILYQLIVGKSIHAFFYAAPRPTESNLTLPPQLDEVLMQALAEHSEQRWPTMKDFGAALQKLLDRI